MIQLVEDMQQEGLATARRQGFDGVDVSADDLPGGQSLFGLQVVWRGRVLVFRQAVQVVVPPDFGAAMLVDDQIARGAIKQRAHVQHGLTRLLRAQHAQIALLRQVGRRVAVVDLTGQEIQQFSVVAFQHDKKTRALGG